MVEYYTKYKYQSREGSSWSSGTDYVKSDNDSLSASELISLIQEKNKSRHYFAVRLESAENRASKKVEFSVRYHYKKENSSSLSSSSDYVYWHNDNPSMSDIRELVLGKNAYRGYVDVIVDRIEKR